MIISHSANNQDNFSPLSEKYLHQAREVPDDGAFFPLNIPHLSDPIHLPLLKKKNKDMAFKKGRGKLWLNYHQKIAEEVGEDAAIFLEEIRTWSNRNALRKSQTMDDYQMEKAGIELAKKFDWSERTHYLIINKLKKKGLLKVGKSYEKDKDNRKTEKHYRMNQYSPTMGYFEITGQEIMTPLERKLFLGEKEHLTPPLEEQKNQGHLDHFAESLCKTHRQVIEKQEDFAPTANIYIKHSSLSMTSKETVSETKSSDPNLTVEAVEKVKECVVQQNERKIDSFSSTQAVEITPKQQERVVSQSKPAPIPPKKTGCSTSAQTQTLEKDFEAFHGFHPSRLREKHEEFLKDYPKKLDHDASYSRFAQTLFGGEIAFGELMKRVKRFTDSEEVKKRQGIEGGRFIKNASSWLRDQGWDAPALASSENDAPDPHVMREKVQEIIISQEVKIAECLSILQKKIGDATFLSWFSGVSYEIAAGHLKITTSSPFYRNKICTSFYQDLNSVIAKTNLAGFEVVVQQKGNIQETLAVKN